MATDYPALFRTYLARRIQQVQHALTTEEFLHSRPKQEQALRVLDYALADPADPGAVSALLLVIAPIMEQAGHREPWRGYLLQGIKLSQRFGDVATEAELAFQVGLLFHRQSRFPEAKQWLSASLTLYQEIKNEQAQSKTLHQLAYIACLQHQYDHANDLVEHAARLAGSDIALQAMTCFVKGTIASDFGRWSEAEIMHRKALELRKMSGDQRRIAWSLLDMANTLRHQQRYTEAIHCCQESATIFLTISDTRSWSHAQMNLGLVYYYDGDATNALVYFRTVVTALKRHNDSLNLARLYTNMGLAFLALDQLDEAEESFTASINVFQLLNDKSSELNATDGLAMSLLAQHRYTDAIARLEQGLSELTLLKHLPTYSYLLQSMQNHLEEAQCGQRIEA